MGRFIPDQQLEILTKKPTNAFIDYRTNLLFFFFLKMTDLAVSREDGDMKDMMSKWETENGVEEDDDNDVEVSDDEDEPEKFHRTLIVPDESFDHVVLGTSDVERSIDDFEKMTGVRPVFVTSLNGLGTKSARGMYPCTFPNCIDFVLE